MSVVTALAGQEKETQESQRRVPVKNNPMSPQNLPWGTEVGSTECPRRQGRLKTEGSIMCTSTKGTTRILYLHLYSIQESDYTYLTPSKPAGLLSRELSPSRASRVKDTVQVESTWVEVQPKQ